MLSHGDDVVVFVVSSRRRHTRSKRDWSADVCSSDLSDEDLFPLQLILRQILILNEVSAYSASSIAGAAQSFSEQVKTAALVKYAVIIVSALPLLIIYPFLQRFFVKGVLIGSVKE